MTRSHLIPSGSLAHSVEYSPTCWNYRGPILGLGGSGSCGSACGIVGFGLEGWDDGGDGEKGLQESAFLEFSGAPSQAK